MSTANSVFHILGLTLLLASAACERGRTDTASPDDVASQSASDEGQQEEAAAPATGQPASGMTGMGQGMMQSCPMRVANTTATDVETDRGGALEFETDPGNVEEVRRRVRKMAEMHNERHGSGAESETGTAQAGGGTSPMMGGMAKMPPSTATAEDTENGARLSFVPKVAADIDAVREHLEMMAGKMQGGHCPMRGKMMGHGKPSEDGGHANKP